jgi:hypothetical protein
MKPSIEFDVPRSVYEAIRADHFSKLSAIAISPAHYKYGIENGDEDTDALRFGRAAHLLILEPVEFSRVVVVKPKFTGKGAVAAREEWEAAHASKLIVSETEMNTLERIQSAVGRCDYALPFLTGGKPEVTLVWGAEIVPGHVMPVKGRLDYLTDDFIVDVKFVRCAAPAAFGKQAWDLHYLPQAAFYSDGYEKAAGRRLPFVLLAVEKEPPFCIVPYVVPSEHLAAGRAEYEKWLATLSLCRLEDRWPGYATGPMPLQLPVWAERQAQELSTVYAEGVTQ